MMMKRADTQNEKRTRREEMNYINSDRCFSFGVICLVLVIQCTDPDLMDKLAKKKKSRCEGIMREQEMSHLFFAACAIPFSRVFLVLYMGEISPLISAHTSRMSQGHKTTSLQANFVSFPLCTLSPLISLSICLSISNLCLCVCSVSSSICRKHATSAHLPGAGPFFISLSLSLSPSSSV